MSINTMVKRRGSVDNQRNVKQKSNCVSSENKFVGAPDDDG
jgi:hypothetical protein